MCAIAGILLLDHTKETVEKMLKTMKRRGPDDSGFRQMPGCTLMHTRLAIIDPEKGAQPMELEWAGERYTITYNGELYNTREIREELMKLGHHFLTHSDTEVLLHAYAQWKEECLQRLNGIFAFGVWEESRQTLFFARDRMGVKPLFFKRHDGGLLFASEIKTILAYPGVEARIDEEGAAQILMLGPGRSPGSGVFRDIYEVEPGYCARFHKGRLQLKQYWSLRDGEHRDSFEETSEKVRSLVLDAIRAQMVSDVPIGTFLSGGLDSSIISTICAWEMKDKGTYLDTFSVDYLDNDKYFTPNKFQPNSDGYYIRMMQEYLSSNHHWTVLTPEDLIQALEDATVARDLPGMADVDFSLLAFCKDIRGHVKVALSGECADEIFGGYPWYRDPEVRSADGFPWAQNTGDRVSLMHPQLAKMIDGAEYVNEQYLSTIRNSDILPDNSPLERRMKEMVNLNYRWFMQTLLDRKDRMSMYHGLEVRVPFCDHRIAEYLYRVPWEYKDYQGVEKGLLRHAMRGILPEEVLYRKKSPYPKTWHPLYLQIVRKKLDQILDDPQQPIHMLVNTNLLRNVVYGEQVWPWYGQLMKTPQTIAYMLQVNFWLKHYGVKIL